jgi:hypothetical protein
MSHQLLAETFARIALHMVVSFNGLGGATQTFYQLSTKLQRIDHE